MSIIINCLSSKNCRMIYLNISNFREAEHGIYFKDEDNNTKFINWNCIGMYTLVEE